jgi:hypothetical protein
MGSISQNDQLSNMYVQCKSATKQQRRGKGEKKLTPATATKAEKEFFTSVYRTEQLLKYWQGSVYILFSLEIILFCFLTK